MSTLSNQALLGIDPGKNCHAWAAKIRSRHFRILEHKNRRNKVHVSSCPDDFDFGKSEWISEKDAAATVKSCFTIPPPLIPNKNEKEDCQVVFVAHNAMADSKYLAQIGYDLAEDVVDIIDTSDLASASQRDIKQTGLATLLLRHGIAAKHLHNAGNDAHYTLHLMLALAVDQHQHKRSRQEWAIEKSRRIRAAGEEAKAKAEARAALDMEGWSTSENDDVSGSATPPAKATVPAKAGRNGKAKESGHPRGGSGERGRKKGGRATQKTPVSTHKIDHQSFPRPIPLTTTSNLRPAAASPLSSAFQLQNQAPLHSGVSTRGNNPPSLRTHQSPSTFSVHSSSHAQPPPR